MLEIFAILTRADKAKKAKAKRAHKSAAVGSRMLAR
jgi:hypothetical protein